MVCTESTTRSVGIDLLDVAEHRAEVGLGREVEVVVDAPDRSARSRTWAADSSPET